MYRVGLSLFLTLFLFSCASTIDRKVKLNKFMDPDTGVETIESIISFYHNEEQDLISFNQTKNPNNISWYIIGKFCLTLKKDFNTLELTTDAKSSILKVGGSYNSYDIKTENSKLFRKVDYYKLNETMLRDLSMSGYIKLKFQNDTESEEFVLDQEQLDAVKEWITQITIPK
ncbi:MAG: hypothetical protein PF574_09550 [Candidatus Delongbacteria bacterium]|jgi:hypothetical protein|nr:hypothetical protein [Candidatus Delongbacteria bacterium]